MIHLGTLTNRDDFGFLLNNLGLVGPGAEIGVYRGQFAETLLKAWSGTPLYLIDPWRNLPDYHDSCNLSDEDIKQALIETRRRTAQWGDRVQFVQLLSIEAAEFFENESLDFVYIDANHAYDSVRLDLEAWYPKVRPGGIVAGHDYYDALATPDGEPIIISGIPTEHLGSFGVKSAVDEFVTVEGLDLFTTKEEWPTWYSLKP